MAYLLQGILENSFKTRPFTDKQTGELTPSTLKCQLKVKSPQEDGTYRNEFIDLNVKDPNAHGAWMGLLDQEIRVQVEFAMDWERKKQYPYIVQGALPEAVTQTATKVADKKDPLFGK